MRVRSLKFVALVLASFGGLQVHAAPEQFSKKTEPIPAAVIDAIIAERTPVILHFAGHGSVSLKTEPLQARTIFGAFLVGYSAGETAGTISSGTSALLLDTKQVFTIFGHQRWVRVSTTKGLSGWFPVDSLTFSANDGSSGRALDARIVPWWRTDSYSVAFLTLGISFAAFFFGVHLRNAIFMGGSWRPLQHQLLLAVPISLVTVPSELMAYIRVLPDGGPLQLAATFLIALGIVAIQGILLPELSWKLIEKKMRKTSSRRRQVTSKKSPTRAAALASIAVAPLSTGGKTTSATRKKKSTPRVTPAKVGVIEPQPEGC
jgi:hypothetical protein